MNEFKITRCKYGNMCIHIRQTNCDGLFKIVNSNLKNKVCKCKHDCETFSNFFIRIGYSYPFSIKHKLVEEELFLLEETKKLVESETEKSVEVETKKSVENETKKSVKSETKKSVEVETKDIVKKVCQATKKDGMKCTFLVKQTQFDYCGHHKKYRK